MFAVGTLGFVSCDDDTPPVETQDTVLGYEQIGEDAGNDSYTLKYYGSTDTQAVVISGTIDESLTLTNDVYWVLDSRVFVDAGTLTIDAGTIVMGMEGSGVNASSLVVTVNGSINAVGTASEPIIFTSVLDNIALGATAGTNLTVDNRGLWGGLVILGSASIGEDGGSDQIEGIPASETKGLYGGTADDDNSGTLDYISIRHGGATIATDNEINGLSLAGVGSGTTVSNIEIIGNNDDGIEIWGGFVNLTNLLIWGQKDDGIDIDEDYQGTIDNFIVIANSSDNMLEIDGTEDSEATTSTFNLTNGTIIGGGGNDRLALFKSAANCTISNVYWESFDTEDEDQILELASGVVTKSNLEFDVNYSYVVGEDTTDVTTEADMSVVGSSPTVGSDYTTSSATTFDWTFAKSESAL